MAEPRDVRVESSSIPEENVWSVGQLNAEIGSVLEDARDRLPSYVVGEVSDINRYDFGTFFDLRDLADDATISCIIWAYQRESIDYELEAGSETILRATVDFYHDDARTQLAVKNFWPVGESDRSEDVAALRAALTAEGLLDEAAKQSLPKYPRHIGVVTSGLKQQRRCTRKPKSILRRSGMRLMSMMVTSSKSITANLIPRN